jgi:hypothetical protein
MLIPSQDIVSRMTTPSPRPASGDVCMEWIGLVAGSNSLVIVHVQPVQGSGALQR